MVQPIAGTRVARRQRPLGRVNLNDDHRIAIGIGYRDGLAAAFDDRAGKLLQVFKIDGDGLMGF